MSLPATASPPAPASPAADILTPAENHLGRALALVHRSLSRLDAADQADAVQAALERAADEIDAARAAHAAAMAALRPSMEAETLALIAAAVAVVLGKPARILGVQRSTPSVTWVNAWAIEGRFQHYSSHRVR